MNSPGSNCSRLHQMCKKYIRAAEARLDFHFFMNWGVAADAFISCFVSCACSRILEHTMSVFVSILLSLLSGRSAHARS